MSDPFTESVHTVVRLLSTRHSAHLVCICLCEQSTFQRFQGSIHILACANTFAKGS